MSELLLRTSQCIFLVGQGDSRDSSTSFTALLASNLLAQFSRQIVIQILGLESPNVCGNLASGDHCLLEKKHLRSCVFKVVKKFSPSLNAGKVCVKNLIQPPV
jgi:hypothetical protein